MTAKWLRYAGIAVLLVIPACASFYLVQPIFEVPWWSSHEDLGYPARVTEFVVGVEEGGFLYPRWCPDFLGGKGYPFFDFYPPGLFFAALGVRKASGIGPVAALKVALLLATLIGAGGMILLALQLTGGDRAAALAAALVWLFAPYRLSNLYVRGALAEFAAMSFIPFVFWGLERIASKTERGESGAGAAAMTALAFAATSLTHAISGVLTGYVGAAYVAARILTNPIRPISPIRPIKPVGLLARAGGWAAVSFVLGGLLIAFWACPATVNQKYVQIERMKTGENDIRNHGAPPLAVLDVRTWGRALHDYGGRRSARDHHLAGMSLSIGLPVALALLMVLGHSSSRRREEADPKCSRRREEAEMGQVGNLSYVRLLTSAATMRLWLWMTLLLIPLTWKGAGRLPLWHLPLLEFTQFPWRLMTIIAMGGAVVAALVVHHASRGEAAPRWIAALAMATLAVVTGRKLADPQGLYPEHEVPTTREAVAATGLSYTNHWEYLPLSVPIDDSLAERPTAPWRLLEGDADVRLVTAGYARYEFAVAARTPARLQIAQYCYPGWCVEIRNPVALSAPEMTVDEKGFLIIPILPGRYLLEVHRRTTNVDRVGFWISLAGAAGLGALIVIAAAKIDNKTNAAAPQH